MKSNIPFVKALLFMFILISHDVQSQHNYWYMPPNYIDVQDVAFNYTAVPNATNTFYSHSNAAYDENGDVYFYIEGGSVSDVLQLKTPAGVPFFTLQGGLSPIYISSDIEIVPVPGACKKFYVIYGFEVSLATTALIYLTVDCTGASPVVVGGEQEILTPGFPFVGNFLGLAVSKRFSSPFDGRYLFVQHYNGIERWKITSTGIATKFDILNGASLPGFQFQYEYAFYTHEFDLFDNGPNKVLVWGDEKLNTLKLDQFYVSSNPVNDFFLYSETSIAGVEVVSDSRFYTCSPNGIRYYTIGNDVPTTVAGSASFVSSELEMPKNLKLMCVKNNGELWYVDDPLNVPVLTQSVYPVAIQSSWTTNLQSYYKLPDQVEYGLDEYDYFQAFPTPVADAGSDVTICQGQSTTLIAGGVGTAVWCDAFGNILCNDCPTYTVTPGSTTTYTLVVTNSLGCASAQDVVTVFVLPNPNVDLGPDVQLCLGEPIQNITVAPCNPNFNYIWQMPLGAVCLNGACNVNPCEAGEYCVEVTDLNGCVGEDCVNVSFIDCTPCELSPIMNVTASQNDCASFYFDGDENPGNYTTVVGQLWDFGDGTSSSEQDPFHTFYYNGNYTVYYTVFGMDPDGNCCSEVVARTLNVECPCKPAKPFVLISQDNNCNFIFSETSAVSGTSHFIAWQWNFGDGSVGYGQEVTHNFAQNGSYNVSLLVTAFNGQECCFAPEKVFKVDVDCNSGECLIEPGFEAIIENGSVVFENISNIGGSTQVYAYRWDFGDGNVSELESPFHDYLTTGTFIVCLTLYGYTENECCSETKCMEVRIEKVVKSAVQNEDQTLNNTVGSESSNKCWMKQNRPNPYIEKSTIDYFLPENIQSASLSIFTLEGVTLRSVEIKQRGFLKYELGQLAITPGIYFATLYADNEKVQTIRIVLVE